MKTISLVHCFLMAALLIALSTLWGCGSGDSGSTAAPTTKIVFSNGASISIVPAGNGNYVVQGDNLVGVAGLQLTIPYDSSAMSSPTVAQGDLLSGAMFVSNTNVPGTIRVAIVSAAPFSGSGQIAAVSFASDTGTGSISLGSVNMISPTGKSFQ
jgi:hypothetical protein